MSQIWVASAVVTCSIVPDCKPSASSHCSARWFDVRIVSPALSCVVLHSGMAASSADMDADPDPGADASEAVVVVELDCAEAMAATAATSRTGVKVRIVPATEEVQGIFQSDQGRVGNTFYSFLDSIYVAYRWRTSTY